MVDELGPGLTCPACRHAVSYHDDTRTVGGRRYHATCVDAHWDEPGVAGNAVRLVARYVERFARVLRR